LDKISHPSPGKYGYSTKPESYIETLFEDLISYFNLEFPNESEISISADKYEIAANFIKQREDERRTLALSQ